MLLCKWTQINIRTLEVMPFCITSRNSVIRYSVRKNLCPSEWRFLLFQMKYYQKKLKYKGAKSIWDWSLSEWIGYAIILIIFALIYYFSNP